MSRLEPRLYGLLLRLAPRPLVDEHGDEMRELFTLRCDEARTRGLRSRVALWSHVLADVLACRIRRLPVTGATTSPSRNGWQRRSLMNASDFRYAVRSLLRQKAATGLVLTMLVLGIAANVAVFGLVNGLFLKPFPFAEPDRLVYINEQAPRWDLEYVGINFPDFHHWREQQTRFESIAYYDTTSLNASDGSRAERLRGGLVTHELPAVLGVAPILGRFFTSEEDRPGAAPVVVLGHGLWQERFGGSENVLGKSLRLDGVARTVVGVMPPAGEFPPRARFWVPLGGDPNQEGQRYAGEGIGRLAPGVTVAEAEADLLRTQQAIWEARDPERIVSPFVRDLREELVRDFRNSTLALSLAVGLLLLVACANVASLMLARALARRREMAIRVAVGASRMRLLAQLLAENLVLAGIGGFLGLLAGHWVLRLLVRAAGDQVPGWAAFGLDPRVMIFAFALSALTVVLFGWAPAFHSLRHDLRSAVSTVSDGTSASPRGRRTLQVLVGAEFALAALLLVCGGLLLQAFDQVRRVAPGFEPRGVLTFALSLPETSYPESEGRLAFWEDLLENLRALPGVDSSAAITCAPLGCHWGSFFAVDGQAPRAADERTPVVLHRLASADYFRTLGVRLEAGRLFDASDVQPGRGRTAVVNRAFVREFLEPGVDPVGRRLGHPTDHFAPRAEIIGVVSDVRHYGLERPVRPGLYFPLADDPVTRLTIALKTRGEASALTGAARAVVRELDPDLALFSVRTMEESLERSLMTRSTYSWLLAVFALLALCLALGGTYGVTAYLATQRTREIGIRMALGAQEADIRRAVLHGSLAVVAVGTIAGLAGAVTAARGLQSLLFGVPPHDLRVLLGAVSVLAATALVANWLPASRAARVDPASILRAD